MINFEIYLANIPKQESVVNIMQENKIDSYVFIAPEIVEWLFNILPSLATFKNQLSYLNAKTLKQEQSYDI